MPRFSSVAERSERAIWGMNLLPVSLPRKSHRTLIRYTSEHSFPCMFDAQPLG
jgi:hypothetical protein